MRFICAYAESLDLSVVALDELDVLDHELLSTLRHFYFVPIPPDHTFLLKLTRCSYMREGA